MIELILGVLIGGTAMTALWIMDLKRHVRKKQQVHDELMAEFGKLTIANNKLTVKEILGERVGKVDLVQALTEGHANPPVPSTPKREQA